jgi:hypothetical protein
MNRNRKDLARRSVRRIGQFIEDIPPEDLIEAEEELRGLGLEASAVGTKLEQQALSAIRARILREHSYAARARIGLQGRIDLSNKLN